MQATPVGSMSMTLRVTSVKPRTFAVATRRESNSAQNFFSFPLDPTNLRWYGLFTYY